MAKQKKKTATSGPKQKKMKKPALKQSRRKLSRPKGRRYSHDDPSLRTGEGGLTIWTLQEMAQRKQFKELDDLFNNGLTMNALPVGVAAGTGSPLVDFGSKLVAKVLDYITIDSRYFKVDSKQLLGDAVDYLVGK